MSFEEIVESRILEAQEAGAFRGLEGEGRPLRLDDNDRLAGTMWAGYRILRNANLLPEWLDLAKEIEQREAELAGIASRHASLVELAAATGEWPRLTASIRACRDNYEASARILRARQDRFNIEAPHIASERPAIWVERQLQRLDEAVVAAGGPEPL